MTKLTGTFETAHASKYLQQLCKHFAHKVDATWSATDGKVTFKFGEAQILADDARLTVSFEKLEADTVDVAKNVFDRHLERFAFRENFEAMEWV